MKSFKDLFLKEAEEKLSISDFDLDKIGKVLEDEVSRLIRVKVKFTHKIEKDKIVRYTSQDLAKDMSPRMMKELTVYTWGGEVTTENYIWISVRFDYTFFDGGSNGHEIISLFVDKDGKIIKKQTKY